MATPIISLVLAFAIANGSFAFASNSTAAAAQAAAISEGSAGPMYDGQRGRAGFAIGSQGAQSAAVAGIRARKNKLDAASRRKTIPTENPGGVLLGAILLGGLGFLLGGPLGGLIGVFFGSQLGGELSGSLFK